jgi:hypothetical protein
VRYAFAHHFSDNFCFSCIGYTASNVYITLLLKTKLNSVALVRERTIPTERPPPVGEGSANFITQTGKRSRPLCVKGLSKAVTSQDRCPSGERSSAGFTERGY